MASSYVASYTWTLLAYLPFLFISYKTCTYIQRLYFHPLSKFPGPKICAASRLYEFYWDSYQNGRFWTKLPALHDKYGPIIRIAPDELHIRDSEYFHYLFGFKPLDKWAIAARQFGLTYAMFGTEEYKQYTQRRAAFGDAFSRSKVLKLQPLVNEKIAKGCEKIEEKSKDEGFIDMAYLYRAVTAEIITEYMYGQQYGFFEDETTTKGLYDRRFDSFFGFTHLGRFITWWIPILLILIRGQIKGLFGNPESMASFLSFKDFAHKMLNNVVDDYGIENEVSEVRDYNVAAGVYLHSSLPKPDKTGEALVQATMAAWSGGWDTTAFALTQGTYFILRDGKVLSKLQNELIGAWPRSAEDPPYPVLDGLPYLDAVIKETLRLMHGALCRVTRVNPRATEQYGSWTIPSGTKISMSLSDVNLDKDIWGDDVQDFRPERWIGHPELNKWLATFSRGTRVCAGEELAWLELKRILGTFFRRFEMSIAPEQGVTDDDILPYYDGFTPNPRKNMQRLPVTATSSKR